ncbi:FAD-binding molybdopterin dehydrogenase [Metarhizobium album]|uniref:FAD-binding molybdopterin dehydrogenase n=1 Tax=Metarhizobium album TaxID=2182425 RepID=A0A2U2DLP6_9HYPH|nr:FAD binding domain-containing protein [Rhizobium album]PWE54191.1 FAD-binding molybdopterin dehydrogenase [Rhizobium album]
MAHADNLYIAASVADAVAVLADRAGTATPLAGATWVMRAPLRREPLAHSYVAISQIEALQRIDISEDEAVIGSCVTHARLAEALAGRGDLAALATAAAKSANPAVRQAATVGGNLCTADFAAADLVPALLCLDAAVELEGPGGLQRLPLQEFLSLRHALPVGSLLCRIVVPRSAARSAHARLPLRKAGDYPVAIASLSIEQDDKGIVTRAAVAVGSVEPVARRWPSLETALVGRPLNTAWIGVQAERLAEEFTGRDGIEAPGWYRVKVLPTLVRRAVEALSAQTA